MDVITKLKQIKHQCEQHYDCKDCIFCSNKLKCKVKDVTYMLCRTPNEWDIEEIERILNGSN